MSVNDYVPLRIMQLLTLCCQTFVYAPWHHRLQIFCSFGIDCLEALSGTCTMYLSKRSSRQVPCFALHRQDHTSCQVQQQADGMLRSASPRTGACLTLYMAHSHASGCLAEPWNQL